MRMKLYLEMEMRVKNGLHSKKKLIFKKFFDFLYYLFWKADFILYIGTEGD